MSDLVTMGAVVPAATPEALEKIAGVEKKMRSMPQIHIRTEHVFHAGMYVRTIRLDARVAITSVLIKIPTVIVVNGRCKVYSGEWKTLKGYNVIPASAGRKMIYVTESPTQITMVFPSEAKNIQDAEAEFTDEVDGLLSHECDDEIVTEGTCQV